MSRRKRMVVSAPEGTYPHGTHAKYVLERCRCFECRAATAAYHKHVDHERVCGRGGNVDASEARAHVRHLQSLGMGYKRIAEAAGLNPKTVNVILVGRAERGTPRPKSIRRSTAVALLAVRPLFVPRQLVPADGVWRAIADLMLLGYSRQWVSNQLGNTGPLQIGKRGCVEFSTAMQVLEIRKRTTEPRPVATRHEVAAATRSRREGMELHEELDSRRTQRPCRRGQGKRRAVA